VTGYEPSLVTAPLLGLKAAPSVLLALGSSGGDGPTGGGKENGAPSGENGTVARGGENGAAAALCPLDSLSLALCLSVSVGGRSLSLALSPSHSLDLSPAH